MLTPKESARLFDMNHRLRNLHTQQAQALRMGRRRRLEALRHTVSGDVAPRPGCCRPKGHDDGGRRGAALCPDYVYDRAVQPSGPADPLPDESTSGEDSVGLENIQHPPDPGTCAVADLSIRSRLEIRISRVAAVVGSRLVSGYGASALFVHARANGSSGPLRWFIAAAAAHAWMIEYAS